MIASTFSAATRKTPFSFTVRLDDEFYEGMEFECAGETEAIATAREVLQARIDHRPLHAGHAQRGLIGVGVGSMQAGADRVIWLGEWEWAAAAGWYWQSSD
jgi:hypothetical protein